MLTHFLAQATCRALVVDALPVHQQQLGAAWGKFLPFSEIVHTKAGSSDVLKWLGWLASATCWSSGLALST